MFAEAVFQKQQHLYFPALVNFIYGSQFDDMTLQLIKMQAKDISGLTWVGRGRNGQIYTNVNNAQLLMFHIIEILLAVMHVSRQS